MKPGKTPNSLTLIKGLLAVAAIAAVAKEASSSTSTNESTVPPPFSDIADLEKCLIPISGPISGFTSSPDGSVWRITESSGITWQIDPALADINPILVEAVLKEAATRFNDPDSLFLNLKMPKHQRIVFQLIKESSEDPHAKGHVDFNNGIIYVHYRPGDVRNNLQASMASLYFQYQTATANMFKYKGNQGIAWSTAILPYLDDNTQVDDAAQNQFFCAVKNAFKTLLTLRNEFEQDRNPLSVEQSQLIKQLYTPKTLFSKVSIAEFDEEVRQGRLILAGNTFAPGKNYPPNLIRFTGKYYRDTNTRFVYTQCQFTFPSQHANANEQALVGDLLEPLTTSSKPLDYNEFALLLAEVPGAILKSIFPEFWHAVRSYSLQALDKAFDSLKEVKPQYSPAESKQTEGWISQKGNGIGQRISNSYSHLKKEQEHRRNMTYSKPPHATANYTRHGNRG